MQRPGQPALPSCLVHRGQEQSTACHAGIVAQVPTLLQGTEIVSFSLFEETEAPRSQSHTVGSGDGHPLPLSTAAGSAHANHRSNRSRLRSFCPRTSLLDNGMITEGQVFQLAVTQDPYLCVH